MTQYKTSALGTSGTPVPDASGTGMIEVAAPSGALAVATGSEVARSPLCYMVEEHVMDLTRRALEAGLENTQGALLEHDAALGRTTRKNRTTAEMLERDIENMQTALSLLPNAADHARPLGAVACGRLFEETAGKPCVNYKLQKSA